ncbi:MAG: hypothetical protein HUJ22_12905 [Gracilimonas sp.]|uniref:PGN_0703 family putative restriction endonuclease n=1 Tax=Gracilimonas sp. TaxID=1974203 RepID=UPI0019974783|nr:hypothetical protein [Gracilimonas sp.]MBD3617461.1 hypothetical protein [Gracilimonas sp.]
MSFSDQLRDSIKQSTLDYIGEAGIPTEKYNVVGSAVIFSTDEASNKNFLPKTLNHINQHDDWKNRLSKVHSHFEDGTVEMASSNSSDTLLMNIFCHPNFFKWGGPQKYLGFENAEPKFGWIPKVEASPRYTEVDMKLGSTIYEAKLTEQGFNQKEKKRVLERYPGVENIFDLDMLQNGDQLLHYQLLRNIYVAEKKGLNFRLLCDYRRPDLLQGLFQTTQAIVDHDLRQRVGFITWQEIASFVGKDLKDFLRFKYGIIG